jgi:hypothetical protein
MITRKKSNNNWRNSTLSNNADNSNNIDSRSSHRFSLPKRETDVNLLSIRSIENQVSETGESTPNRECTDTGSTAGKT